MERKFKVHAPFQPAGDQPKAIEELADGLNGGERFQTLLGITGSGKSATVAWTIEEVQRPTLVIAPNNALAAQLANEFPSFYSRSSGIKNIQKINSVKEIIDVYVHGKAIQNKTALLVTNPVPRDYEIPTSEIETIIKIDSKSRKDEFYVEDGIIEFKDNCLSILTSAIFDIRHLDKLKAE